jgi:N-acylneuraminate cytidylyltransferase
MKNRVVCIIPARGGSKRIPKKNIKDFLGRPVISYSIHAAISSNIFDEVFVSTDDPTIAEVARKYGANADILREASSSDDNATTADVLTEILNYERFKNAKFICCLYPVAPLINKNLLECAYNLLLGNHYNSIIPITEFEYPIERRLRKENDQSLIFSENQYENTRTQDLETFYHDAGMFYFLRVSSFKRDKKLFLNPTFGIELEKTKVQDIDNPIDWDLAELKYKLIHDTIKS